MDIIETTMDYIKYDISDLTPPLARLEDFYRDSGILNFLNAYVAQYKLEPDEFVIVPQQVIANKNTIEKLKEAIRITWREYNVDRNTGTYKRNKPYKYKNPRKLNKSDEYALEMHFLNLIPKENEGVPDDECWVKTKLEITHKQRG